MDGSARSCATCAYWEFDSAHAGICRRYPPPAFTSVERAVSEETSSYGKSVAVWPRTLEGEWCGEWQARELREEEAVNEEQERDLRNASMAQALMVLPAEKRDRLLDAILTDAEKESPFPPADFYERVHEYLAGEKTEP